MTREDAHIQIGAFSAELKEHIKVLHDMVDKLCDKLEKEKESLKREDEEILHILQNGVKSGNRGQSLASMQVIKVLQDRINNDKEER